MLTDRDREIFKTAYYQRIRDLLPDGEATMVQVDAERTLHVVACSEEHCAQLARPEYCLPSIAWISAGADHVVVWLATSEDGRMRFWEAPSEQDWILDPEVDLELMAKDLSETVPMPTAIAEAPATTPTKSATVADLPSNLPQPAPAQNLAELATDLQQSEAEVLAYLASNGFQAFSYEGRTLVTPEAAIAAVNHFSSLIGQRILQRRGLWGNSTNGTAPTPAIEATPTKAVSTSRPKQGVKPKTTASKPKATGKAKAAPTADTNGSTPTGDAAPEPTPAKGKTATKAKTASKPKATASKGKTAKAEAKQETPERGPGGRFLPKNK